MPSVRAIRSRFEGLEAGVAAEQRLAAAPSALSGGERVEPELAVVGLAAPAVPVLGAVVDEEQEAGRRQALDQAVESGLGLGVDPVEVLEDDEERLDLALPQEQPLERVEGPLPALRRVERLPPASSTGTSRSARKAGSVGSSARSSVRSLPVTFSRIAAGSSRSSIWK